jgi:hypothetical protein
VIGVPGNARIYLACGVTDMRKGLRRSGRPGGEDAAARPVQRRAVRLSRPARESAKLDGRDPEAWLTGVIDRMAKGHPINRLGELLLWNWHAQDAKLAA